MRQRKNAMVGRMATWFKRITIIMTNFLETLTPHLMRPNTIRPEIYSRHASGTIMNFLSTL